MARLGRAQPFRPHLTQPLAIHNYTNTFSDTVTTSETFNRGRSFSEILNVTDVNYYPNGTLSGIYPGATMPGGDPWDILLFTKQVFKALSDNPTTSDLIVKVSVKALNDNPTVTDSIAKVLPSKTYTDVFNVTDSNYYPNGVYSGVYPGGTMPGGDPWYILLFSKLVGKALSDIFSTSDSKTAQAGKGLTDTVTITDTKTEQLNRSLSDTVTPSDSKTALTGKNLSDSLTPSDSDSRLTGKGLSDTVTTSDSRTNTPTKGVTDTITVTDRMFSPQIFVENLTLSEVLAKFTSKAPFTDSISVTDSIIKLGQKVFSDALTLTETLGELVNLVLNDVVLVIDRLTSPQIFVESISVSDSISRGSTKVVQDVVVTSDSHLFKTLKSLLDNVLTNDLGLAFPWLAGMTFGNAYPGGSGLFLFFYRMVLTHSTRTDLPGDTIEVNIYPETLNPNVLSELMTPDIKGGSITYSGGTAPQPVGFFPYLGGLRPSSAYPGGSAKFYTPGSLGTPIVVNDIIKAMIEGEDIEGKLIDESIRGGIIR